MIYDNATGPIVSPDTDPYASTTRTYRDVVWTQHYGSTKRKVTQDAVEAPATWSDTAVKIVTEKYFRGDIGTPSRETSVYQMIDRVVDVLVRQSETSGYLSTAHAEWFRADLRYMLINQMFSFNSPVWFNVGTDRPQQTSACFIVPVEDSLDSILATNTAYATLFKSGSGVGSNYSNLRSSKEQIANSVNTASGPVSFMRAYDAFAGVMKSGGATRRSATMRLLDDSHPDILEFIDSKVTSERAAHALVDAGFPSDYDDSSGAYGLVPFQSANHSVRLTNAFMYHAKNDGLHPLIRVTDGAIDSHVNAKDMLRRIARAAWECGDPGVQFSDTINSWHTCANDGRINASNPCSEYVFLDNTSCNLGSLNLCKFLDSQYTFNIDSFVNCVRVAIVAMDLLIEFSDYPTEAIAAGSHKYRTLGLGYANLGAMLMSLGVPYDPSLGVSGELAASITSLMTSVAYATSIAIAERVGGFPRYEANRFPMNQVLHRHRDANGKIALDGAFDARCPDDLCDAVHRIHSAAQTTWDCVVARAWDGAPIRNAQVTVLAPTGTIAFMMDCATTGIEPDFALTKWKHCVGGDILEIVNPTVRDAVVRLLARHGSLFDVLDTSSTITDVQQMLDGYTRDVSPCEYVDAIVNLIHRQKRVTGIIAPELIHVFACAARWGNETSSIQPRAHVAMMAVCQPFLSGAISKTVNMPHDATVEDVENVILAAYESGVKCVAIYRDGCKASQPLQTKQSASPAPIESHAATETSESTVAHAAVAPSESTCRCTSVSRVIPADLPSHRHKVTIGGEDVYIHTSSHEGQPVEVFLTASRVGSTMHGLLTTIGILVSHMLRSGAFDTDAIGKMLQGLNFAPHGFTSNPEIRSCKSIPDYLAQHLQHMARTAQVSHGAHAAIEPSVTPDSHAANAASAPSRTGNLCHNCGEATQRAGSCEVCPSCGTTTGCG